MYRIELSKLAKKQIEEIPVVYYYNIEKHLDSLAINPYPKGCKKLAGSQKTYRIRVGVYRIIYEVHNNILIIRIITISHRKDAYK